MKIASLYRYPVKGLSPEPLERLNLARGQYVPGDRLFAIENGPSGFAFEAPEHQPKVKFLMLMRNESLARLRTRFDDETGSLIIEEGGREVVRADLREPDGRQAVETFFCRYMPGELRGPPKVLGAPDGFRFTDSRKGYVSIISLASVRAFGEMAGRELDPLRFRGNIMVEGLEPWAELDLVGQVLTGPSGVRLKVTKRIVRCAAINVDPASGARDHDVDLPTLLLRRLGHADCGIYAEVLDRGAVAPGDELAIEPERQGALAFG